MSRDLHVVLLIIVLMRSAITSDRFEFPDQQSSRAGQIRLDQWPKKGGW
jgi:hypothetical protein